MEWYYIVAIIFIVIFYVISILIAWNKGLDEGFDEGVGCGVFSLDKEYKFLEDRYNELEKNYFKLKKEGSTDWLYIGGKDYTEIKKELKSIIKNIDDKINNALIYHIQENGADIIEFFVKGKSIGRFTKQGAIDFAKKNLKLKAENFKAEPNSNPSYAFEYGFTTILPLIHTYYEVEKKAKGGNK